MKDPMQQGIEAQTCRWKLSNLSARISIIALVLRSSGIAVGKSSSSFTLWAMRAATLE